MVRLNMTFPEGFFKEEEKCGHLISAEMKKVWAVDLDLLNEFMRVCDKHGFKYWAGDGTLLGAARHEGFIPWDDDIDMIMMRAEYEELCKIAPSEFKHPYFWQTAETDKGCLVNPAKLRNSETTGILLSARGDIKGFNQGIFIDIFQLDSIPDDEKLFKKQVKNIRSYKRRAHDFNGLTYHYRFVPEKNVYKTVREYIRHLLAIGPMKKHFDYTVLYRKFDQECQKYNGTPTKRIGELKLLPGSPRRIYQRSWFDETVYLPFEMFRLPAPKEYEKFLDVLYGDWRKFVKGTSIHGGVFFDTEKPYTEYIKQGR